MTTDRDPFPIAVAKGRYDVVYWAKRFLDIDVHPGQIRMAQAYLARQPDGWRAAYLTIAVSAGNRAGKTMALAIVVLHSVFYKMGSRPPRDSSDDEINRWRRRPYLWFHFAIQQEIAELVFTELANIFQGIHVAQREGVCPLADDIRAAGGASVAEWEKKYNGDYRWIVLDPILGGGEIHFRTTAEGALGSLGRDMHGISFDECGFAKNLRYVIDNVLHLRRLGTGGQMFLVSTPEEGLTEFADEWFKGDPEQPDRQPRRMSVRMSTRENVGYGIDQTNFDSLTAGMDEDHIKQNIDGYFIAGRSSYFNASSVDRSFIDGAPEITPAAAGGTYIQGVDPGLKDRCWSLVFRLKDGVLYGVKAEYARSKTTEAIVALAVNNHSAYELNRQNVKTTCDTAIDTTALGGHMFRDLVQESLPEVISVEFGGNTQVKRRLLGDLKTMLDKNQIRMPRSGDWLLVRRQLAGFKLNDRHIEQDAVMALACVVKVVRRYPDEGTLAAPFDSLAVGDTIQRPKMPWDRGYVAKSRPVA